MPGKFRGIKIATVLGPATDHDNNLEKTIAADVNAVYMNFSRGSPEDHKLRADKVREIVAKLGRRVAISGGLQRPKIRVPTFKEGRVLLNVGDKFLLNASLGKDEGDKEKVGINYKGLLTSIVFGDILLLDDGRVQLKVLEVQGTKVFTEVTVGGPLSNNKGINKLDGGLSAETLTEKDEADITIAAQINADYLTVSFLRCGEDLNYAHCLARDIGRDAKIVVKVERAEVVCDQNVMDDIILAPDIVMVARDDLGVRIDDPELVGIQKALAHCARQLNRVVATATQMMEPVITNLMPARAEVMDVANAALDGTDVVTFSAETATGQYPAEAVTVMIRVRLSVEEIPGIGVSEHCLDAQFDNVEEAIAMLTIYAVNHLKGATVVVAMAESDRTTLMTSRISSGLPVFATSRHKRALNLTSLYRGAIPIHFGSETNGTTAANEVVNLLHGRGCLVSDDLVIAAQNDVMSITGLTDTTRILTVEQRQYLI